MTRLRGFLILTLFGVGFQFACGSKGNNFNGDDASVDSGMSQPDSNIGFNLDGASEDAASCTTCSSDLHDILACGSNEVLQTCTGTTGCGQEVASTPALRPQRARAR